MSLEFKWYVKGKRPKNKSLKTNDILYGYYMKLTYKMKLKELYEMQLEIKSRISI